MNKKRETMPGAMRPRVGPQRVTRPAQATREPISALSRTPSLFSRPREDPLPDQPPADHRPRILVVADTPNWAWQRKAIALRNHLSDRFNITIAYTAVPDDLKHALRHSYDLVHTFECIQVGSIPGGLPLVTGITAHVWQTWEKRHGEGTVKAWAERARGFHANSRMLQRELEQYLGRSVWYVPNGVDEAFWRRLRPPPDSSKLIVGHVARPNPRKGGPIVAEACRRAGAELRTIERNSKDALPPEEMREFYQGIHVLAVSSDFDGTPNPALEAAACECAVVSNHIGNMPEFIQHGVNGLLTDRSIDGLAAALLDLATKPRDAVLRMGKAARQTVLGDWTWVKRSQNYAEMWTSCLAHSHV